MVKLARIAFANMRDYWPKEGETLDLHRLDQDRTAAVEELTISEKVGTDGCCVAGPMSNSLTSWRR